MISRRNAILVTLFGIFLGGLLGYLSPTLKNPKLDIEFWAYVAGTVIAICALFLTYWQATKSQEHNMLSVEPRLNSYVEQHVLPEKIFVLSLKNLGLGPAIIKTATVRFYSPNGDILQTYPISNPYYKQRIVNIFKKQSTEIKFASISNGSIIAKDEILDLIHISSADKSATNTQNIEDIIERTCILHPMISIYIKYESLYGKVGHFIHNPR